MVIQLRILLVTRRYPPAPGGVETQVMETANRLGRRGHRVFVYCSDLYRDVPPQHFTRQDRERLDGVEVIRYRAVSIPWREKKGTSVTPAMLCALIRMNQVDLAHCQGLNLVTAAASLMIRLRQTKVICTTHLDPILLSNAFLAKVLASFDGLVALTETERRRMLSLGLDESKIRLIPNGIDMSRFNDMPRPEVFRRKFAIATPLITYAGRIAADKGCDVLVEAVARAKSQIGECTLLFAGADWGYRSFLQRLSRRKGVRAIFTGNLQLEDLKAAFVASDVFVLPSLREAFGLSVLEAMLCGVPVVASFVGGVPSIVRDEDTGLLVRPSDPWGLAEAICRIVTDRELSTRLVANAKKMAAKYSIESTVTQLEKYYEDILRG